MSLCDKCDDGLILRDNTLHFCECSRGQERLRNWTNAGELVKAEAEKDRQRRARKVKSYRDGKAEAAGERQPGEEG